MIECKVSSTNWLCIRNSLQTKWIPVCLLTEDQAKDLQSAIKGLKSSLREFVERDALVRSVDILNDR